MVASNGKPKRKLRYYPWKEWFRRRRVRLHRHADYNGFDSHFLVLVRRRAAQYGVVISAHVGEGFVEWAVVSRARGWEKKVGGRNQ